MGELAEDLSIIKTYEVAKTAVVRESAGRLLFLVLWRSEDDERRPGQPDLPGGELEAGESWQEAAARETAEEASIELEPANVRLVREHTTHEPRPEGAVRIARRLCMAYVDDSQAEGAAVGEEHRELAWLPQTEAEEVFDDSPSKRALISEVGRIAAEELPFAS